MSTTEDLPQGPKRRAPRYYAGDGRIAGRPINRADVERHANGAVVGTRDKAARRLIRKALTARASKVERGLRLARGMQAQAREVVSDEHYDKSSNARARMARRLYESELAIHQPVYVPTGVALRYMRTEARKLKRKGQALVQPIDIAIDEVVTKYTGDKPL